jgi:omega-amidase
MSILKTLLVQPELSWKDPSANRNRLDALVDGCSGGFDLVVVPETFTTGFLGDDAHSEETMNGPSVEWMRDFCGRYGCALAGSLVISEQGHRYNRLLFVTADGILAAYDKRHLFSFGGEDRRYTAGDRRVIVDYQGWRINLQICYDLRFPVWCRNRDDYDLMVLVANWPAKRVEHWSALLRARAIENQAWVIGVNRVGEDGNGIPYPGCSVVHDPRGGTLADLGSGECCRLVELDSEAVARTRSEFPFQSDADPFQLL